MFGKKQAPPLSQRKRELLEITVKDCSKVTRQGSSNGEDGQEDSLCRCEFKVPNFFRKSVDKTKKVKFDSAGCGFG
jgi:hypothetical protein